MTIYEMYPGVYKYYIYNYSNSPDITTSSAVVQIYNQNGLLNTLQVPTIGSGLYWYICDVDGNTGQITIINTIQPNSPDNNKDPMPPKAQRNVTTWQWDFGDGTSSTEQNPVKVYQNPGVYSVSLVVGNGMAIDEEMKSDFIVATNVGSIRDGLIAYYPFNGNAEDLGGRDHHGTVNQAVMVDDRFGSSNQAYNFDGTDDYIEVPHHVDFNLTNKLTISCWIRHDEDPACFEDILMKGGDAYGLQFACDGTGTILFHLNTDGVHNLNSNIKPVAGSWYHITGVYDGAEQRIYVNGVLKNSVSLTGNIHLNSMPFTMGYKIAGDNAYFKGIIDEVRVYNRAFSPSEVPSLVRDAAGIGETDIKPLEIYPNPAKGVITVRGTEAGEIRIFDLKGVIVKMVRIDNNVLDISYLQKGVYILQFTTDKAVYTTKFIKE